MENLQDQKKSHRVSNERGWVEISQENGDKKKIGMKKHQTRSKIWLVKTWLKELYRLSDYPDVICVSLLLQGTDIIVSFFQLNTEEIPLEHQKTVAITFNPNKKVSATYTGGYTLYMDCLLVYWLFLTFPAFKSPLCLPSCYYLT